jgi:hypothetical protein
VTHERNKVEIVAQFVLEVVCCMSGHFVLCALTLGRWKTFNGRDDAATVVGILFWVAVAVGVWFTFFR